MTLEEKQPVCLVYCKHQWQFMFVNEARGNEVAVSDKDLTR